MKNMILMALTMLIVLSAPVLADSMDYCLNTSYAQNNRTMAVVIDGNTTTVDYSGAEYCSNGCSDSLGECRINNSYEVMIAIIIIIIMFGFLMITNDYSSIYLMAIAIASISSVMLGASDVFSSPLNVLFLILPIGLALEYIITMKERKENDE